MTYYIINYKKEKEKFTKSFNEKLRKKNKDAIIKLVVRSKATLQITYAERSEAKLVTYSEATIRITYVE